MGASCSGFELLPNEVIVGGILPHLNARAVLMFGMTTKRMRDCSCDQALWRSLCRRHLDPRRPTTVAKTTAGVDDWMRLYREQMTSAPRRRPTERMIASIGRMGPRRRRPISIYILGRRCSGKTTLLKHLGTRFGNVYRYVVTRDDDDLCTMREIPWPNNIDHLQFTESTNVEVVIRTGLCIPRGSTLRHDPPDLIILSYRIESTSILAELRPDCAPSDVHYWIESLGPYEWLCFERSGRPYVLPRVSRRAKAPMFLEWKRRLRSPQGVDVVSASRADGMTRTGLIDGRTLMGRLAEC